MWIHPNRRLLYTGTALTPLLAVLAACSMGSPAGNGGAAASGGQALTIDSPSYPSTLDPGLQYDGSTYPVYRNIYDQLLRRDSKTLKPVPWIASSWEQTSPTSWQFKL